MKSLIIRRHPVLHKKGYQLNLSWAAGTENLPIVPYTFFYVPSRQYLLFTRRRTNLSINIRLEPQGLGTIPV